MTPAALLRRVVQVLQTYGWHQGSLGNERTGYCLMGAYYQSGIGSTNAESIAAFEVLNATVRDEGVAPGIRRSNGAYNYIPPANDDPRTTVEDVQLWLKKAIAVAEETEAAGGR